MIIFYSNELQINEFTSPIFIIHSTNDKVVSVGNSILLHETLKRNNVMVEMYIFPHGGHGFAFTKYKGEL